jgi:carboxyl-terminal processing protease
MKNKFLTGFFSGLAGALVIVTICFTIYAKDISFDNKGYIGSSENSQHSNNEIQAAENTISTQEIMSKVDKLEGLIDKYYMEEVNKDKLADGIYKGLLAGLGDPYSTYYTVKEYAALMESSNGIYCGIGSTVTQNVKTGVVSIVKPFVNGPAYESGLLPGDILYKVAGEEVTGLDLTEVVSRIKGEEGSSVSVEIIREGVSEPMTFNIKRRVIEVPTIEYQMLDGKIGYILITEFDEVTAKQFRSAVTELEKQGQVGLIVDVRDNPGGRLDTVADILDRMLPQGLIVYTEDKYGTREELKSTDKEKFSKPLTVLINGNSASASEIFAGAIQDYKIGTIVGTTSFGKGIVQSIIPLKDGSAIKVTVSKYYTPNGRNIHGLGIEPDVAVELDPSLKQQVVIEKDKDNQLQKAIQIINEKVKK